MTEYQALEDTMNKVLGQMFGRPLRWSYFASINKTNNSRSKDMYFYTTERNGKGKFTSGIYRYTASKKTWRAIRTRDHRKRMDAKARAIKFMKAMA